MRTTSRTTSGDAGLILPGGKKAGVSRESYALVEDVLELGHGVSSGFIVGGTGVYPWSSEQTWHEEVRGGKTILHGLGEPVVLSDTASGDFRHRYDNQDSAVWEAIVGGWDEWGNPSWPITFSECGYSINWVYAAKLNATTGEWDETIDDEAGAYYDMDTHAVLYSYSGPRSPFADPPQSTSSAAADVMAASGDVFVYNLAPLEALCAPPDFTTGPPPGLDTPPIPRYPEPEPPASAWDPLHIVLHDVVTGEVSQGGGGGGGGGEIPVEDGSGDGVLGWLGDHVPGVSSITGMFDGFNERVKRRDQLARIIAQGTFDSAYAMRDAYGNAYEGTVVAAVGGVQAYAEAASIIVPGGLAAGRIKIPTLSPAFPSHYAETIAAKGQQTVSGLFPAVGCARPSHKIIQRGGNKVFPRTARILIDHARRAWVWLAPQGGADCVARGPVGASMDT